MVEVSRRGGLATGMARCVCRREREYDGSAVRRWDERGVMVVVRRVIEERGAKGGGY